MSCSGHFQTGSRRGNLPSAPEKASKGWERLGRPDSQHCQRGAVSFLRRCVGFMARAGYAPRSLLERVDSGPDSADFIFACQELGVAFIVKRNPRRESPEQMLDTMQGEVHDDIQNIFNMPSKEEAESLLKRTIDKYKNKSSELAQWLENELPEGVTVFAVAASPNARRKLRTTNMVEFQNKELKKRTRCIKIFPNRESLLRIASALLIELDDLWLAEDKVYLGS